MALEVHIEEQYVGPVAPGQGEAFIGCRGFDDGPALGRQRHPSGRTQAGIVVGDEDCGFGSAAYSAQALRLSVLLSEQASRT